jgi:hypothetical protein
MGLGDGQKCGRTILLRLGISTDKGGSQLAVVPDRRHQVGTFPIPETTSCMRPGRRLVSPIRKCTPVVTMLGYQLKLKLGICTPHSPQFKVGRIQCPQLAQRK